ncbi:hypothetical protein HU200_014179 [Digitaria exilis]|uniref:Glycosyltransferase n=1 Tax=Digitaria exilis TaxID=1010633 RepID=A0A835A289_9POAL|nr:hypothetical protein HU200_066419 [Digitaria exilis]KAF8737238.1 hypothetical protein HU200_014179 [Digitaria exilis]CAB3457974.1 unnamed protein product [Digitaria exilis]
MSAAAVVAHALVFPFPLQGHINSMLPFATALVGSGVHVTFLHTDHNLRRLGVASATGVPPRSPSLRFVSVPDGLRDDDPRSVGALLALVESLQVVASVAYRALLASLLSSSTVSPCRGDHHDVGFPPVTCVVSDGYLPWAIDIADELGVPALAFRTSSACSVLAFLSVPRLLELGELPFPEGDDLDENVRGVSGMETFLRRRDLPSSFRRVGEHGVNPRLRVLVKDTFHSSKARALVLNTAASLERSSLSHIAPHMRDVFAVGPLNAMSPAPSSASATTTSLWREDDRCMAWLDGQADRSVVYASLGSLAVITREQFTELLSGLVSTGYPFLWVLRPDMVRASQHDVSQEVARATGDDGDKARVVAWAQQRDVLRHRAVGCFLTHAGWNSTLEAAVEGVPMVCWPFFADQQINSRFVGAVWKNGLDMKDVCDRAVVERMVREAMESAEIRRSAEDLARRVKRDVAAGGSSATEFQRLIGFIRELSTSNVSLGQ